MPQVRALKAPTSIARASKGRRAAVAVVAFLLAGGAATGVSQAAGAAPQPTVSQVQAFAVPSVALSLSTTLPQILGSGTDIHQEIMPRFRVFVFLGKWEQHNTDLKYSTSRSSSPICEPRLHTTENKHQPRSRSANPYKRTHSLNTTSP